MACAAQVQTALTKVTGVESALVNYADDRAIVAVHPDSPPDRDVLIKAIDDAGFCASESK